MIAYNPLWLSNLFMREQADKALQENCLDKDEWDRINNKYPVHFYSPNVFIRIGLFMLTTVILLFSFGLFALLFLDSIDHVIGGLAIFFGLLSYAALEYMVQIKKHFQSGVDDALLWIAACSVFGGISYLIDAGDLANCMIVFCISIFCSLRFADRLMSAVLYVSLLGVFFFMGINLGNVFKAFIPFVIMAISITIYWLIKRTKGFEIYQPYSNCLQVISISALLSLYVAGNYYVVRELSNTMFNLNLAQNEPIPMGWLFWCFTLAIPCFYIFSGIQKKDIVLIRIGLLLVAAIIFTVRYYYSVASVEVIMTVGGILLVAVSYGLTRYLKSPKFGFTNIETDSADVNKKLQIESILLAQTFTSQVSSPDTTNLGGGNFGGGGASGEF